MIGVYSFWGKPFWKSGGGYLSGRHFLSLLLLSVAYSKRHFTKVEMYCCSESKAIFEDMDIFDRVVPIMDALGDLPDWHWAVAKMLTFSAQQTPFLHIDNDAFISKPLPKQKIFSPVISQCAERYTDFHGNYKPQLNLINAFYDKPMFWRKDWPNVKYPFSYNTGIFGGCDIEFIQRYATSGVEFMLRYGSKLGDVNTTIEQAYLAMCCAHDDEPMTTIIDDWRNNRQAKEMGYRHYWGGTKRGKAISGEYHLDLIEQQLQEEFPYVHELVPLFANNFNV